MPLAPLPIMAMRLLVGSKEGSQFEQWRRWPWYSLIPG